MVAVGAFVAVLFVAWLLYEVRGSTDATGVPTDVPTATSPAIDGAPAPDTDGATVQPPAAPQAPANAQP